MNETAALGVRQSTSSLEYLNPSQVVVFDSTGSSVQSQSLTSTFWNDIKPFPHVSPQPVEADIKDEDDQGQTGDYQLQQSEYQENAVTPEPLLTEQSPLSESETRLRIGGTIPIPTTPSMEVQVVIPVFREEARKAADASKMGLRSVDVDQPDSHVTSMERSTVTFLSLPPEVKNMIYDFILPCRQSKSGVKKPCHIDIASYWVYDHPSKIIGRWSANGSAIWGNAIEGTKLLRTCKEIHAEVFGYIYGCNVETFQIFDTTVARLFFSKLRTTTLASLRDVDLGWLIRSTVPSVVRLLLKCTSLYKLKFRLTFMPHHPFDSMVDPNTAVPLFRRLLKQMYTRDKSIFFRRVKWVLPMPRRGSAGDALRAANSQKNKDIKEMIMGFVEPSKKRAAKERPAREARGAAKKTKGQAENNAN